MNRVAVIEGQGARIVLVLPDRGMPIVAAWEHRPRSAAPGGAVADLEGVAAGIGRAHRINGMDVDVPSAVLLPTGGMGRFGWPAIAGHRDGRDFVLDFGGWTTERPEPNRLVLAGRDAVAGLALEIDIAVSAGGVVTMRTALVNQGADLYTLDRCMAATVLAGDVDDILSFEGTWGREFQLRGEALGSALWIKENRRGRTSHDRFPALVVGSPGLAEGHGECLGLHLGWSGNHVLAVEPLDDGRRLIHAGELFEPGEIRLASGEAYRSPTAFIALCPSLAEMSAAFHAHVRGSVLDWPGGAMSPRPVTLNTWEGNYFDHDLDTLKRQASAAAAIGVERFVLDDGWFKGRHDETTSLGDWEIDARKYPKGLAPLVDHVTGLGMEFGLWIEPEMVSPDSDLFRAHPEWALQVEGRPLLASRKQMVLDVGRPEVSDHLFTRIDAVLSACDIKAIKWDMNRDLTAPGGAAGRAATSRQTRAVYALMGRLRAAHPRLEIESCSSGGGRADYGALALAHRVWTSDCTDALERQEIQRGASLFLPPEVMGAHISASPNHQTGRRHSLSFRALTAMPYHFGLELNPLTLEDDERAELTAYIALHRRLRPLLHGSGQAFRHPVRNGRIVHGIVAPDGSAAVVHVAQAFYSLAEQPMRVSIPHLDPCGRYRLFLPKPQRPDFIRATDGQRGVFDGKVALSGAALESIGVALPDLLPESAVLIEVVRDAKETHAHG